jgi:hypothetical protein
MFDLRLDSEPEKLTDGRKEEEREEWRGRRDEGVRKLEKNFLIKVEKLCRLDDNIESC